MKEIYDHYREVLKLVFPDVPDDQINTWEELTPEQQERFERLYTHLIVLRDAALAEKRYQDWQKGQTDVVE